MKAQQQHFFMFCFSLLRYSPTPHWLDVFI